MKKITIALIVTLLFTSCTSCQNQQNDLQQNEQQNQQQNKQGETLTICVDSQSVSAIRELVDAWEGLNEGAKTELFIIPSDTAAAETKITEIRTEMMSGGGPDVFILQCANPNWTEPRTVLFSNPEKMMYSETFLPLDEYMDKAQYMNTDGWNQTVLESGRTDEGQILLPMYYEYYASAFRTVDIESVENIPSSWDELITCEDKTIIKEAISKLSIEFHDVFGEIADYKNDTLLFSEEDLLARIQEAVLYTQKITDASDIPESVAGGSLNNYFFSKLVEDHESKHTIFAFPNMDGGITANVTMFAAINRNTELPEEAFSLLDILFSDEAMCNEGFQVGHRVLGSLIVFSQMGISVNNAAFQKQYLGIATEDVDSIQRMNNQISVVRYYSDLDRELLDTYLNCRSTRDDSERKKIVSHTYDAIRMQLSE